MKLSTLYPFSASVLLSTLLVAAAMLLWRVPAAQAAHEAKSAYSCVVLDKRAGDDAATRRVETMLTLHRGW